MTCVKPLGQGPGAYKMPPLVGYNEHDPTRYRNPMYSFGVTGGTRRRTAAPGPYGVERVTRNGAITSPAWTLGARLTRPPHMRTPGPGAHAPEHCPPTRDARAPAYSMGARLDRGYKRVGPAPNAYGICVGPGGPAYTMGAKLGFNNKALSPGPAIYFQKDMDLYKNKMPAYSMRARLGFQPGGKSPGPASYPPDLYDQKKTPYKYSFGIKHAPYACPMIVKEDTMDCL